MYNDQILKLNNEQIENLDNLLSVLKNLQTAIVQNDLEKIESTIEQEEKVLNRIKLCEEKRFDTLKTLLNHYGIKAEKTEALDELAKVILTSDPEAYQCSHPATTDSQYSFTETRHSGRRLSGQ